ncbi:hypothetical protein Bcop_1825 [Bacteroides coprosuis DSM 18011]|uniref:Uncharacterized protein n=1 Tax=Bacteroides coprosuis DSM 18011 TaxID=679937 RepID=F3ZRS4_9BACE|nr:hypothetical protein [Bacteroides coprosuis]EGJ72013.1 hypothetical protein Bcop_1825 [Bacteroides coprosuis DSM 18011]
MVLKFEDKFLEGIHIYNEHVFTLTATTDETSVVKKMLKLARDIKRESDETTYYTYLWPESLTTLASTLTDNQEVLKHVHGTRKQSVRANDNVQNRLMAEKDYLLENLYYENLKSLETVQGWLDFIKENSELIYILYGRYIFFKTDSNAGDPIPHSFKFLGEELFIMLWHRSTELSLHIYQTSIDQSPIDLDKIREELVIICQLENFYINYFAQKNTLSILEETRKLFKRFNIKSISKSELKTVLSRKGKSDLNAFLKVNKNPELTHLEDYIKKYPNGLFLNEVYFTYVIIKYVRDIDDWIDALLDRDYHTYVLTRPNGLFLETAKYLDQRRNRYNKHLS